MANRKMKKSRKPKAEALGTGMAARAGKKLGKREEQICKATGGKWVPGVGCLE